MADPAAATVDAVTGANQAFYAAIESADLDLMSGLWLPGEDTFCVHPGAAVVRGTAAILRSWALVMANTGYIQFFLTDVSVVLRARTALVSCTENILTAPDPAEGSDLHGGSAVGLNVFERTEAGWQLWSHQSSPTGSTGSVRP